MPIPAEIEYHQKSRILDITFDDGARFNLTSEYLRVYSPSAEVRGHSEEDAVLQVGKADVKIEKIEAVGNYAVLLRFDDGHDTGIYSWDWLYTIGLNKDKLWREYLEKLEKAGGKRGPDS
ncbi:MAG: DUF971 domain-containing protein [Gammaproteobacteria bacterium]|nr:DUF971 domain-containing protein [Gammaproteobacteria bacterium]